MSDLMTEERIETVNEMGEWIESNSPHPTRVASGTHGHGRLAANPLGSGASTILRPIGGERRMIVQTSPLLMLPGLNLEQLREVDYEEGESIMSRFEKFHATNPHVYENLRELALAARRAGQRRSGAKALYEILRYATIVTTGEIFKLNNNFTAIYARLLMKQEPELRGFFTLRERRAL